MGWAGGVWCGSEYEQILSHTRPAHAQLLNTVCTAVQLLSLKCISLNSDPSVSLCTLIKCCLSLSYSSAAPRQKCLDAFVVSVHKMQTWASSLKCIFEYWCLNVSSCWKKIFALELLSSLPLLIHQFCLFAQNINISVFIIHHGSQSDLVSCLFVICIYPCSSFLPYPPLPVLMHHLSLSA